MSGRMRAIHLLEIIVCVSLIGCSADEPKISAVINQSASLDGQLPANPLQWNVITSEVDPAAVTMSTLYGNEVAVGYARTNSQHEYPTGSVLSLVTWTQMEDGRWFGARIPHEVKSVEFVMVRAAADGGRSYSYQEYEGTPLKMSSLEESSTPSDRAAYLLSERAAVMP